jgi:hypothetical protein
MRRAGWGLSLCLTLCFTLMGCPSPTQYGGPIPVDHQGLAQRMGLLCQAGSAPAGHCVVDPGRQAQLTVPADAGRE